MMMHAKNRSRRDQTQSGFVMVAVLVIAGVAATLAATYGHHVIAGQRTSLATPSLIESREAAHSAAEYARHALLTGQSVASSYVGADGSTTTLAVTEPSTLQRDILVQSSNSAGDGSVKLIQATFTPDPTSSPTTPDSLPHLPDATIDELLADSSVPKTFYAADAVVSDADLQGLHIIEDGVQLTLSNVVLEGAILTESAMNDDPFGYFDALTAPTLVIDGNVRIDSSDDLPGIAILMPDGIVGTGWTPGSVQLQGDIVAHSVTIDNGGSVNGHIQSVSTPILDSELDQVFADRKPKAWTSGLEYGDTWDPSSIAVLPSYVSVGQLSSIINYWSN